MHSLSRRIALILAGALLLIAIGGFLLYRGHQAQEAGGGGITLPEKMTAIVDLLEQLPAEQQTLALRALASPTLQLHIATLAPVAHEDIALHGLAARISRDMSVAGEREVHVNRLQGNNVSNDHDVADGWVQVVIRLKDGRYLIIEPTGGALRAVFGGRVAIAASAALLFVGLLSLSLVRAQIRPLEELVGAVERFGETLDSPELASRGAEEVRLLVGAFNRMRSRIRALIDGRTRLLAAISHDLGTYLTRLRLRAEFIDDDNQRERAVRDIEEMNALLRDSLLLSQPDRLEEVPVTADPQRWLQAQLGDYAGSPTPVHLIGAQTGCARLRPMALKRVLSNLIENACKYGGGAEVQLQRSASGSGWELLVEDRGPGIPAGARELVLEPFYRGDTARNLDLPGFGLGLSIVTDILLRHGGTLALEDRPGGGLRVRAGLGRLVEIADELSS